MSDELKFKIKTVESFLARGKQLNQFSISVVLKNKKYSCVKNRTSYI